MFSLSKLTMNLSSVHLSEAQISILDKGLNIYSIDPLHSLLPYSRMQKPEFTKQ